MTDVPTKLLIGGELRDAAAGATFATFDPAHGGELATVARAGTDDVDAAVTAARGALEGAWAKTSPAKRARALNRLAQLLDEQTDALAELESRNNGKVKWQCVAEIKVAVSTLELFAGTAQHLYGRSHVVNPAVVSYTLREPVGVVGAIIPWNYPLMMAAWKVAPALATGNTMVLKPASATPLTAIRLGELALEAGIPAGVLNVVPGPGAEVGEAIAAHPGIDKVAFTGETDTGRRIAAAAATTLKRVSLELGGKSPNIVFADADLDAAVIGSLWAIFYSAGQSCEARSRILVQDEVYDAFASAFAEKARALTVGRSAGRGDEGRLADQPRPCRSRARVHRDRRRRWRRAAGRRPRVELNGDLDADAFVAPTVIAGVGNDARIAQEEVFGPVVTLTRFGDEAEAVQFANDVRYGLAATVWTAGWLPRPSRRAAHPLRRGRHQHPVRRLPRRAVRRLQGVRLRSRAVDRGARPLHRDEGDPPGHLGQAGQPARRCGDRGVRALVIYHDRSLAQPPPGCAT